MVMKRLFIPLFSLLLSFPIFGSIEESFHQHLLSGFGQLEDKKEQFQRDRILILMMASEWDLALQSLNFATKDYQQKAWPYELRAFVSLQLIDSTAARRDIKILRKSHPSTMTYLLSTYMNLRRSNFRTAQVDLMKAMKFEAKDEKEELRKVKMFLAKLLVESNELSRARISLDQRDHFLSLFLLSQIARKEGKKDDYLALKKEMKKRSLPIDVRIQLWDGDPAEYRAINELIEKDRGSTIQNLRRANLMLRTKNRLNGVRELFEKQNQKDINYYRLLAKYLKKMGDDRGLIEIYQFFEAKKFFDYPIYSEVLEASKRLKIGQVTKKLNKKISLYLNTL